MITLVLLEDISGLGQKGSIINTKDGYAFNYLIPKNKARIANAKDKKKAEVLEQEREAKQEDKKDLLKQFKKLAKENEVLVKLVGKAEGENLFAAFKDKDVANAVMAKFSLELDPKKEIKLPEPLKTIGVHPVIIKLEGVEIEAKVEIQAEE